MGKGFNNYMCKKFFHPASRDNLKRVWMAEQKTEAYKKKQDELRMQYEKEQDLYDNKAMLSKESKDKLSVNFMYEPPPGSRKDGSNDPGGIEEVRFEWQRKYQAPRESYCKGDIQVRDQPFGIQVRNVRCIKCHKWGHINTDKECSMYSMSMSEAREIHSQNLVNESTSVRDNLSLEQQMFSDGLALKKAVMPMRGHELLPNEDQNDTKGTGPEGEFLKALSTKQKKELLKKLEKLEKKSSKAHKKKKDKKKKRKHHSESSDEDSNYESEIDKKQKKHGNDKDRHKAERDRDNRHGSDRNREYGRNDVVSDNRNSDTGRKRQSNDEGQKYKDKRYRRA